jgi:peptidoglycan/xylan/chitin deacetylase (PgdA/CDA1 family)
MTPTFALSRFESRMFRLAGSLFSRRGRSASMLVLIFHRVLPEPDALLPNEPDARTFAAQMSLLAGNFNVLPLREATERLYAGSLPERAVCVTFDDGYANNCEVALPILAALRLPATVFVAPGFLDGKWMFNDVVLEAVRHAPQHVKLPVVHDVDLSSADARIAAWERIVTALKYLDPEERLRRAETLVADLGVALPRGPMMTEAQVAQLHRAGIEIGAHTMSHPILTKIDGAASLREMVDSRNRLQEMIGSPVRSFAYPNGRPLEDYDRTHVALVAKAGFDLAVSTAWGAATIGSDRLQIPRIAPWDKTARRYLARMVATYRRRRFATA